MEQVEYGSVDLISIDEIVARTKVRLGIKDISDYDAEIEMFINEAASKLKAKPTFVKKDCKIEICDGRAKLPKGFKEIHSVLPLYDNPNCITDGRPFRIHELWCGPLIYAENNYITECRNELKQHKFNWRVAPIVGTMQIQGSYLTFPIPCKYTHVLISYDGYAVDKETGILEMHPDYEKGFSEYARAMMLDTYNFLYNGEPHMLASTIERSMKIYIGERWDLVGQAFADDMKRNKYMVKRILHGLLQDQNRIVID